MTTLAFPAKIHQKLTAPVAELTAGEIDYMYKVYNDGVIVGEIPFLKGKTNKQVYTHIKEKTGFSPVKVIAFILAINEYAETRNNDKWRNPLLRVREKEETIEAWKSPVKVFTSAVGEGAQNISQPITKPLIIIAVIAASGAIIYGGWKLGAFKAVARKMKK